jgi:phosphate transport system permease protein
VPRSRRCPNRGNWSTRGPGPRRWTAGSHSRPYPIWTFYNLPSKTAQDLSYDTAFLLIVFLLVLIILGRLITWFARRNSEYL